MLFFGRGVGCRGSLFIAPQNGAGAHGILSKAGQYHSLGFHLLKFRNAYDVCQLREHLYNQRTSLREIDSIAGALLPILG